MMKWQSHTSLSFHFRFMRPTFFQRLLQGRLLKFCLVGLSSTVIDKGIFYALMTFVPVLPWFVSQSISFLFGVTNGFYWNRQWTFAANEHAAMRRQYPKFVLSNVVGLALNLLITKAFLLLFIGNAKPNPLLNREIILVASLCAIPLVVIWNFTASRMWTFKAASTSSGVQESAAPIAPPH